MFKVQNVLRWMLPITAALVASCMNNGTEIPNGSSRMVSGRLLDANNNPVSGAIVQMVPVNYVPSLTLAKPAYLALDTTDANGYYHIRAGDPGIYNIDCRKDTLGSFIDSVRVPDDSDDVLVPDHRMKKVGIIKGVSYLPGQNDTNQVRVTLYIPGTGRITKPVIGGAFAFEGVPEGRYEIIIDPTLNDYNVRVIDIILLAGSTLNLGKIELSIDQSDTMDITTNSVSGTWGPGKTYRVFADIAVPAGTTLTVLPGAKVVFMGNYYLKVHGTLISNGKPDSLILYSCAFSGWGGIQVDSTVTAMATSISYSIIEKAEIGLLGHPLASVFHCVFRYCNVGILSKTRYGTPLNNTFINNVFHDNAQSITLYTFSSIGACYLANNIFINSGVGICRLMYQSATISLGFGTNFFGVDSQFVFGLSQNTPLPPPQTNPDFSFISQDTSIHIYPSGMDPEFTNLSRGNEDYHLKSTSPCKGTGMNGTDMGIYSTYAP